MPDQKELVRRVAFVAQELPRVEAMNFRAACEQLPLLGRESRKEWMLTQNALKSLHWSPPFGLQGLT